MQTRLHVFACQTWILGEQIFYRIGCPKELEQGVIRNACSPDCWASITDVGVNNDAFYDRIIADSSCLARQQISSEPLAAKLEQETSS